ncbi:MAG: NAD(P)H-hydrate epimerase [Phycisphaerae bacterium]|nr:NAD(P)H-hydrate epimerase [Phycisphaerae bacterium]
MPTFTRSQAADYDRQCSTHWAIPSLALMAHASAECALAVLRTLSAPPPRVLVLCGPGNNGGDGYAVARALHSHGVVARACAVLPPTAGSDAAVMYEAARRLDLLLPWAACESWSSPPDCVLVDSLLGTGISRAPEGELRAAVRWLNSRRASGAEVIAIDVPSGLDADSGEPFAGGDAVHASRTLTMVAMKSGFAAPSARKFVGAVEVLSIGGPPLDRVSPAC